MKTSALTMNFTVDRENSKIKVEREFAAPLSKVWAAWTESELLDQWWAPKPYKAVTKHMDFREGGHWLYAMTGPDDFKQWSRADYISIKPQKSFSGKDAFCDEKGNLNHDFPVSLWNVDFRQETDSTFVSIAINFERSGDLDKYIEMGFKEGLTAAMENLDKIFEG